MTSKSLSDLNLTFRKWAIHRSDGTMITDSIRDTRQDCLQDFLKKHHPYILPVQHDKYWRYWQKKYKYACCEVFLTVETLNAINAIKHGNITRPNIRRKAGRYHNR